jgi:hypothetical protein
LDTNETNRVIPAAGKITDGYSLNDLLPASSANYLWGWTGDWLEWLDERSEDGATPGTDLTLRGLDALTVTSDGGTLTLIGGDGGGTSGDGGDIILLPGSVTSGTQGYLGIGTATPSNMVHVENDSWVITQLTTTDNTRFTEVYFTTEDSGTKGSWEVGAYASSHATRAGEFYMASRCWWKQRTPPSPAWFPSRLKTAASKGHGT